MSAVKPTEIVLSGPSRSHAYMFEVGALFAGVPMASTFKRRRSVTIFIALDERPFELRIGTQRRNFLAAALKPLVACSFRSAPGTVACIAVGPDHHLFSNFRGIGREGVLALTRESFEHLVDDLRLSRRGELCAVAARELFEEIVSIVSRGLPEPKALDRRIREAIGHLQGGRACSLHNLASVVHLSYYRMSHLFAENVGLPLRSYQLWQRTQKALALVAHGRSQTVAAQSAGFTDTSHLHRVCCEEYGVPPSFFSSNQVTMLYSNGKQLYDK